MRYYRREATPLRYKVIHITGASGSGTTTLGRAIRDQYGYRQLDSDDFIWVPTDPPFTEKRPTVECQELLMRAVAEVGPCLISGSMTDWSEPFMPLLDLVIYIDTPTEERMRRLRAREYRDFGERILPGGDMHEDVEAFLDYASRYDSGGMDMRSAALHRAWMERLTCPVVIVDGTRTVEEILGGLEL